MKKALVLGLLVVALVFVSTAVFAQAVTVTGTVQKGQTGICIKADKDTYSVAPCKCAMPMPDKCPVCKLGTLDGKTVKVTGTVEKKGDVKTITVTKAEEVK